MTDNNNPIQENRLSFSYSPTALKRPQGIMKSTPRLNKIVDKILTQPNHESIELENSSTDDFPVQPPIRQIEVVYLDTTPSENNSTQNVPIVDLPEDTPTHNPDALMTEQKKDAPLSTEQGQQEENEKKLQNEPAANDEERKSPAISPTKSSISSIHMSDFFNQDEF